MRTVHGNHFPILSCPRRRQLRASVRYILGFGAKLVKGKGKQMVFHLQVKGKDGQPFWVTALVDTGTQASLIRTGLAGDLVKPSKRPLRLVTANGEVLGGGDKEVELLIHFLQRSAEGFERVWKSKGCFHEADIDDDPILGYP